MQCGQFLTSDGRLVWLALEYRLMWRLVVHRASPQVQYNASIKSSNSNKITMRWHKLRRDVFIWDPVLDLLRMSLVHLAIEYFISILDRCHYWRRIFLAFAVGSDRIQMLYTLYCLCTCIMPFRYCMFLTLLFLHSFLRIVFYFPHPSLPHSHRRIVNYRVIS